MTQLQINELKSTVIKPCFLQEQLNILGGRAILFFHDEYGDSNAETLWEGYFEGDYEVRLEDKYRRGRSTYSNVLVFSMKASNDSRDYMRDVGYIRT